MKITLCMLLVALSFLSFGSSDASENAGDLEVDFSWGDMKPCGMGIPEIVVTVVPENAKYLVV